MAKYIRATQKQFIKRGAWRQNYPQHGQGVDKGQLCIGDATHLSF